MNTENRFENMRIAFIFFLIYDLKPHILKENWHFSYFCKMGWVWAYKYVPGCVRKCELVDVTKLTLTNYFKDIIIQDVRVRSCACACA